MRKNRQQSDFHSTYLQWVKAQAPAKYELASSAVSALRLRDLPVSLDQLELSGTGPYGYPPLLEAIAALHGTSSECVVTATGTSMANHLAMSALAKPGDEVLIEQPTYEPLLAVARYLDLQVRRFQRREGEAFRLDPDEVGRNLSSQTRLIVITNLHNPSSALADEEALAQIGAMASRTGAHVLVDEVYLPAAFEQNPRTAFALGEQFIVTGSLTKFYGLGGLRCGWIVAQPEITRQIWMLNTVFGVDGVHLAERLAVLCFQHLPEISRRSRDLLTKNWMVYTQFLETCPHLQSPAIACGTTSFPRLREGSVEQLAQLLRDQFDTSIVPGCFFERPQHFRIGLGLGPDRFAVGLDRLRCALDVRQGGSTRSG